jgi:triosephosphate isomerase
MYVPPGRAEELLGAIQARLARRYPSGTLPATAVLCPSFVSLAALRDLADARLVRLGAQDCHWEDEGPFTGAVSAAMLNGLVDYVMVGHGERRAAGDTDEQIRRKVGAAVAAGLVPILFVGEDEPTEAAIERADERLAAGVADVDLAREQVLVVYEPTWAIGAEEAAPTDHVEGVVEHLKRRLRELGASEPRVIYGGTVSADNVERFARLGALDGVGATRAGLDADGFMRIFEAVASAAAD